MSENTIQRIAITPFDAIQPVSTFEPFKDRLSRDIRNALSRALNQALVQGDMTPVEALAASFLDQDLDRCYREYVQSRLTRYRQAFAQITHGQPDPFWQSLVLWDLQLFFEVHEILEHAWYHAHGSRKILLQAMIRAAGVYIKLEFGYTRQAAKLATKAREVLARNSNALRSYFAPEELLQALATLDPKPPLLLTES